MLSYKLCLKEEEKIRKVKTANEIEMDELRRKAEALAQRSMLENFELRQITNELRDEIIYLLHEIRELVSCYFIFYNFLCFVYR